MRFRLALASVLIISTILRFYNLDWSRSIIWHPDERNMAMAIEQMRLPDKLTDLQTCFTKTSTLPTTNPASAGPRSGGGYQLQTISCNFNPHFFAYGGLPLYLSFFGSVFYKSVTHLQLIRQVNFQEATMSLRILSALSSVLSVFAVYLIGKLFFSRQLAILTALLTAFIPSLIQSAHFGTTESLLGFFLLLITYSSVKFYLSGKLKYLIYGAILVGLALGTKISVISFITGPIIALIFMLFIEMKQSLKTGIVNLIKRLVLFTPISILVTFLAAPFNLLAFDEFKKLFDYDIPVALGKLPVFYTEQFVNTTPIVFQLQKILPYALGLALTITGTTAIFICLSYAIIRKRLEILILFFGFLPFLILNLFYFTKWTRYISPTFPFFALSFVLLLSLFENKSIRKSIAAVILLFSIIQGLAMFSIYAKEDTRFAASNWIYKNIPSGSIVLSETANVSDVPVFAENITPSNYNIKNVIFNFYDLDVSRQLQNDLIRNLTEADYIIVPSRRIFKNYQRLKDKYPIVNNYYKNLFGGGLGFEEVARFTSFPQLSQPKAGPPLVEINDEDSEETFTVFDHPVIRIFKKTRPIKTEIYYRLLGI